MTQTARRVARGSGRAAGGAPVGRPPRGQLLTASAASWYAALPERRRELVQDSALALGLAALNLLSLLPYQSQLHPLWAAYVLVCAQCLPLAVRRVWPVPALICSGVLRDLYDGLHLGFAPLPLAPAIAFATVADRSRPALRWITVAATAGGVAYSQTLPGHNQPYDAIVQASIFAAAWAIGTADPAPPGRAGRRRVARGPGRGLARRRRGGRRRRRARADRPRAARRRGAPREPDRGAGRGGRRAAAGPPGRGVRVGRRDRGDGQAGDDGTAPPARPAPLQFRRSKSVARTVPADSGPVPLPPGRPAGVGPGLRPPGDLPDLGPGRRPYRPAWT